MSTQEPEEQGTTYEPRDDESDGLDDWARSQAIEWMMRSMHNLAIEKYMADRSSDRYEAIHDVLETCMKKLANISFRPPKCRPPWCRASNDRCVPCGEN